MINILKKRPRGKPKKSDESPLNKGVLGVGGQEDIGAELTKALSGLVQKEMEKYVGIDDDVDVKEKVLDEDKKMLEREARLLEKNERAQLKNASEYLQSRKTWKMLGEDILQNIKSESVLEEIAKSAEFGSDARIYALKKMRDGARKTAILLGDDCGRHALMKNIWTLPELLSGISSPNHLHDIVMSDRLGFRLRRAAIFRIDRPAFLEKIVDNYGNSKPSLRERFHDWTFRSIATSAHRHKKSIKDVAKKKDFGIDEGELATA